MADDHLQHEHAEWSGHHLASDVSDRVRDVIAAAEAAAGAIRHEAEQQAQGRRRVAEEEARRLVEDARRDAEALLAERIRRISALSDQIIDRGESLLGRIGRAEEVRRELEALVEALGRNAAELARDAAAGIEVEGVAAPGDAVAETRETTVEAADDVSTADAAVGTVEAADAVSTPDAAVETAQTPETVAAPTPTPTFAESVAPSVEEASRVDRVAEEAAPTADTVEQSTEELASEAREVAPSTAASVSEPDARRESTTNARYASSEVAEAAGETVEATAEPDVPANGSAATGEPRAPDEDLPPAEAVIEEPSGNGDDELLGARLVALQMAVAGGNRGEVEAHLRRAFELPDPESILDDVFGPGTDSSKRVVWPSAADG